MAFTIVGNGHFLGSGHPDLREDLPVQLGLIESTDSGKTWEPLALQGDADFHALEPAGDVLYGYDAVTGSLMASRDRRTFDTVTSLEAIDLAVDPVRSDQILATTPTAGLLKVDATTGQARPLQAPPLVFVDWPRPDLLAGLGPDGPVQVSRDGASTWQATGEVPGAAAALEVTEDAWYVATDQGLFTSDDEGKTWEPIQVQAS